MRDDFREITTKDHVRLTGIVSTTRVGTKGPHQDVGVAVAVDVTSGAHRTARIIPHINAVQAEAVAAVERGEVQADRKPAAAAKDHVRLTGVVFITRVGSIGPH